MEKRVTGFAWKTPEKKSWKFEKEKGPDMGSYDPTKSYKMINSNTKTVTFTKVSI
jgi:hypothetical protein